MIGGHAPTRTGRSWGRWPWVGAGALVMAVALGVGALVGLGSTRAPTTSPAAVQHRSVVAGTYTTVTGTTASLASLRGQPAMVWFVAGGCASCAASIPAVASHFDQLTGAGLRILTLGLFGAFAPGAAGAAQVLSFGRAAAGANVERRGWQWGMASRALSMALDPSGIPDLYVLLGPSGRISYANRVPVSTMGQLLSAARRLGAPAQATAALGLEPCCP